MLKFNGTLPWLSHILNLKEFMLIVIKEATMIHKDFFSFACVIQEVSTIDAKGSVKVRFGWQFHLK